ncbi:hypothetical protein FB451DRAFT_1557405, partial [Mycena latifolia]
MSTPTRPDSAMETFTKPTRIYMACVNCRAAKVKCLSSGDGQPCSRCTKKRLECEYLAVPDEQAQSGSTTDSRRRSRKPPPPSGPTPHVPPGWTQAPPGYGASDRLAVQSGSRRPCTNDPAKPLSPSTAAFCRWRLHSIPLRRHGVSAVSPSVRPSVIEATQPAAQCSRSAILCQLRPRCVDVVPRGRVSWTLHMCAGRSMLLRCSAL